MNVLVVYASRYGSTKGIAERIAATLARRGYGVEALPCEHVHDLQPYGAVVLGSPVYDQVWLPEATEFVRRSGSVLLLRYVWLFSVGSFGDRHPVVGAFMRKEPQDIGALLEEARPQGYRVFAGVVERRRFSFVGRCLFRMLGGRWGDHRDWAEIDAWAEEIGAALAEVHRTSA